MNCRDISLSDSWHEQVAKLAYELWERNGRPTGTATRDWLLAEELLRLRDPSNIPFGAFSLEAAEEYRGIARCGR